MGRFGPGASVEMGGRDGTDVNVRDEAIRLPVERPARRFLSDPILH